MLAIPSNAGKTNNVVTQRSDDPERRFTNVGIQ
jgi:hypothetical protein